MSLVQKLPGRLAQWAPQLNAAELCYSVEPFILAAIIDRESLGGEALRPRGPTGTGDGGHGHGLGQIDDRFHLPFIRATFDDGKPLWQDPTFGILYSARLLRRLLNAFKGDFLCAIAAYNAGESNVRREMCNPYALASPAFKRQRLNAITAGDDYVNDVLRRRADFLGFPEDSVPVDPLHPPPEVSI